MKITSVVLSLLLWTNLSYCQQTQAPAVSAGAQDPQIKTIASNIQSLQQALRALSPNSPAYKPLVEEIMQQTAQLTSMLISGPQSAGLVSSPAPAGQPQSSLSQVARSGQPKTFAAVSSGPVNDVTGYPAVPEHETADLATGGAAPKDGASGGSVTQPETPSPAPAPVAAPAPAAGHGAATVKNPPDVKDLPECSLSKTNQNCKLIIDRSNLVSPSPVQMYSNQTLTVVVKNPKKYERYFLDYQSGQAALLPDVSAAIVQGVLPSLKGLQEFGVGIAPPPPAPGTPPPDPCTTPEVTTVPAGAVEDVIPAYRKCFAKLAGNALDIYRALEPSLAPDSLTPNGSPQDADLTQVQTSIRTFLRTEIAVSSMISVVSKAKMTPGDADAVQQLTSLQKQGDAVATDLLGYSQRITDLRAFKNGAQDCTNIIAVTHDEGKAKNPPSPPPQCVYISSKQDDDAVYHKIATRTITYSVNVLNLISNSQEAAPDPTKKKLLATVTINFADYPNRPSSLRWEPSAGAFFSSLPIRSFSVAPVFTNGAITNNKIARNVLHPTVEPFAAANYRISNDLGWTRWKSNIYLTGAIGVNPNTVSADFAGGLSISWRSLMFSPLWHLGHDVRLTQGLYVGESLGASFKGSLPTQTYWTNSVALGVSIRVPSLTGR